MLTPQLYPPPPYNFPLFNCRFKLFHFNFGGKVSQSLRKASYYVRVTYTAFIIKWNHVFIYLQQGGFIALLFVELLRKGGFIYYTYNSVSFPCLGVSNFEPQTCWFKDLPPPCSLSLLQPQLLMPVMKILLSSNLSRLWVCQQWSYLIQPSLL